MAEYIGRIDFINKLEVINGCVDCDEKCRDCGVNDIKGMLRSIPAADVAPVVHGKWLKPEYEYHVGICSLCGCVPLKPAFRSTPYNYCPNCGAKMDGGGDS